MPPASAPDTSRNDDEHARQRDHIERDRVNVCFLADAADEAWMAAEEEVGRLTALGDTDATRAAIGAAEVARLRADRAADERAELEVEEAKALISEAKRYSDPTLKDRTIRLCLLLRLCLL